MGLLDILLGGNEEPKPAPGLGWMILDALLFNDEPSSENRSEERDKSAWDDPDWEEDEWEEEQ